MHGWIELPNMIINDDITISEIPNKRVKIKCELCIRRGLFRKTELMARFGSVTLIKNIIAELIQCAHMRDNPHLCGAKVQLIIRKK
jgi:hypothetical protein